MNNEQKRLVFEAITSLEKAVFNNDLSLVFAHEKELKELAGETFSMGFLNDLTEANQNKGLAVVDIYLIDVFKDVNEGGAKQ
jgi:hypothetical protein